MVSVVTPEGLCLFANTAFEEALGLSRRAMLGMSMFDWLVDASLLRDVVAAVARNDYATSRLNAELKRHLHLQVGEVMSVQVIATRLEHGDLVLVELVEAEQQTRQDREERVLGQAKANKELIRNLAHEIKNPLGGIRGAAQLLADGAGVALADRVHPGHHPRGRPAAVAGGPLAGAAPASRMWWGM
jgi:two-component system nitrogen regulation sensor histidine kinase GlnL